MMRRSLAVLLSVVLTALAVVGPHSTAAVAATESGKVVHTWFTGTIEPGTAKTGPPWLNVLPDWAYGISTSPVGASSSNLCYFRVERVWNEQRPEGNKDFWYRIRNVGSLACAANVMVYRIPATKVRSTGGIAPGEVKRFEESSIDDSKIYRMGLLPSGATSSDRCKLEVTRLWYTHRVDDATARRVFGVAYEVKNVGGIACQGDVLLGSTPIERSWSVTVEPWWPAEQKSNNASPAAAYVSGLQPQLGCTLELLLKSDDVQRINTDGSVEREVGVSADNPGEKPCDAKFALATI
jgi:hypothetical protein